MRLIKILDIVNQIEKSSFLKIVDNLCNELRKTNEEINNLFCQYEEQIKNIDDANIVKLFKLTSNDYIKLIEKKLQYNDFHLGILIDIMIRDGNAIMSRDWLAKLYNDEISDLQSHIKSFLPQLDEDNKEIDFHRKRDYITYKNCVKTAFENDELQNRERVVSVEEKSILNTLSHNLDLSVEESRMIYFSIVPLQKLDIDYIITSLKELGIIFFNRKTNTIYLPDEIIWLLRELVGVELSNKYFRRILRQLKDSEINRISKKHNIDIKLERGIKINQILKQGTSVKSVLLKDIYKDNIGKSEKKNFLQELIQKNLNLKISRLGANSEERVEILIKYFNELEQDENIGISLDGYIKLLSDLNKLYPDMNNSLKDEFELQQENVLSIDLLLNYNIKPLDILDLLTNTQITKLSEYCGSKSRGNIRLNILDTYKDIENLYLENYDLIARRDLLGLKEKGIEIKESELGIKFEEITKKIFEELKYNVDETLRKKINTKRSQIDILLNIGNNEVIIVECKTIKDKDYSKYSSVTRQLKSYEKICVNAGYRVLHVIIVSSDFSEDFIGECEYDIELNLSLLKSKGILKILNGFKDSKLSEFPTKLFLKSGLLDENRIVMALNR